MIREDVKNNIECPMTELAALIFDVDGTLADTERDGHRLAFNATFAEAGLDWDWTIPLYGDLLTVTGGKERIRHYLDHYNTSFQVTADLDDFIARLHVAKTNRYTKMLAQGNIPLRTGVKRLLQEARDRNIRLAIATTTTPANITVLLEHVIPSIPPSWFEVIAGGSIVPFKKPAADIYQYVLQKLGLVAEQCIAFEDSENGLRSACGAGIKTVITVNDYTCHQEFPEAVLVLDHLGEPDQPFTVLKGPIINGARYVNIGMLQRLQRD